MTDPFVQPEEPTAAAAIEAISEDLNLFDDWMERYEFIISMGRKLPPFPGDWANDAHRVPGCQSRVWMEAILRDGALYFAGQSDAAYRDWSRCCCASILAVRPRKSWPPIRSS